MWLLLCRTRDEYAKKEDATGASVGAAQPKLTRTERRKLNKERAAQKQDGTDPVLDQKEIAASRAYVCFSSLECPRFKFMIVIV